MSEIVNRLKLNKFSLFLTVLIAVSAAFFTLVFALLESVRYMSTIVFRVFISFACFAVVGYFLSSFIEKEYLDSTGALDKNSEKEKEEKTQNEEENIENPDSQTGEDEIKEQDQQENNPDEETKTDLPADDSFDRIVVVDDDIDG